MIRLDSRFIPSRAESPAATSVATSTSQPSMAPQEPCTSRRYPRYRSTPGHLFSWQINNKHQTSNNGPEQFQIEWWLCRDALDLPDGTSCPHGVADNIKQSSIGRGMLLGNGKVCTKRWVQGEAQACRAVHAAMRHLRV